MLRDAVNNVIEIVENERFCLVYRPLSPEGLTWATFKAMTDDGSSVAFTTAEPLVDSDTDSAVDIYRRTNVSTALISTA